MKFFAVAALFAGALAAPTVEVEARTNSSPVCPNGLYSNPVCADVDVLGILCLNAVSPSEAPRDANHFREICAKIGKEARCAVVPILNQAVLCNKPVGITN
ncbi:Hydrophobin 2 [Cordyceps fumosorosea ARSEF 2679]|uniref:Hydrophobin 2 n=1 Tax=Cordyceps fumosorosea (strain ARSEF 2679) TaxID=1081104 RepID=A0A167STK9_CORFA|nr:Hydrophobin 2 [Cordyceps fumosorosea ARSEF 2679]OAA59913.1 Hydrophobin 2 [Cordyceps fumosorosea ARSEF 2679]